MLRLATAYLLLGAVALRLVAGRPEEAAQLLDFKASFENGEELLPSWQPGTDNCAWEGVSCVGGWVDRLTVMELGLVGQIPQPNGWQLPARLKALELGVNLIRGPIPPGWRLPDGIDTMYMNNNPLGGSLSADWQLPAGLFYLLLANCSLSGPLPDGWRLPPKVQSIVLNDNKLTGTFPVSTFGVLPNLQVMSLQNNALTGPLPATMTFNTSYEVMGLGLGGNNFSGPVPSWPDLPRSSIELYPGNEGVCGELPKTPALIDAAGGASMTPILELPPCPGQDSGGGGGLSAGAIAGIAVGAAVGVAALAGAAIWARRRRQVVRQPASPDSMDLEPGKSGSDTVWTPQGSSHTPTSLAKGSASAPHFNPFAGGPRKALGTKSHSGSSGSGRLTLAAAAPILRASSGSGEAGGGGVPNPLKIAEMERNPPSWLISPDRLVLEQGPGGQLVLLGRGAYARVYRGFLLPAAGAAGAANGAGQAAAGTGSGAAPAEGLPVAIKVIESAEVNAFLKEAGILEHLNGSPQVVPLLGACVIEQQLVVVMELCEGGDLRAALSADHDGSRLGWRAAGRHIALEIAEGLAYLHARNVTHRDLKSKNVLLTADLHAKVADVGGAAMHSATFLSAGSSGFGGTLAWAAPELLLGQRCTHKVDMFSLGVVLFEIATREVPQRGLVAPPPPSPDCPQGLSDLIAACLLADPDARPTAQQALESLRAL